MNGLQRNFNGIDHESFGRLVTMFFNNINSALLEFYKTSKELDGFYWKIPDSTYSTIRFLRASLEDHLAPGENPNTAAFRYIMLIDSTDSEAAVSLLYSLRIFMWFSSYFFILV